MLLLDISCIVKIVFVSISLLLPNTNTNSLIYLYNFGYILYVLCNCVGENTLCQIFFCLATSTYGCNFESFSGSKSSSVFCITI